MKGGVGRGDVLVWNVTRGTEMAVVIREKPVKAGVVKLPCV
mgnify:CR=1 FL=1